MLEIIAIVASLASPLVALMVGKAVSDRKETRDRRHRLFESLWLNQYVGAYGRLSPEFVRAFNMVEIEFSKTPFEEFWDDSTPEQVLKAWSAYRAVLDTQRTDDPAEAKKWDESLDDSLQKLLHAMACALGYSNFDLDRIRRGAYAPINYLSIENENRVLKKSLLEIMQGDRAIPVIAYPADVLLQRPHEASNHLPSTNPQDALPDNTTTTEPSKSSG